MVAPDEKSRTSELIPSNISLPQRHVAFLKCAKNVKNAGVGVQDEFKVDL